MLQNPSSSEYYSYQKDKRAKPGKNSNNVMLFRYRGSIGQNSISQYLRPGFASRPFHVTFVASNVGLRHVSFLVLRFAQYQYQSTISLSSNDNTTLIKSTVGRRLGTFKHSHVFSDIRVALPIRFQHSALKPQIFIQPTRPPPTPRA